MHLVARTPPAWADAGQRISLALFDPCGRAPSPHPHPRPNRRFRLDLHRHLWDASRAGELWARSGAGHLPDTEVQAPDGVGRTAATHRWAAEAQLLLRADGHTDRVVTVRLGNRRRLLLDPDGPPRLTTTPAGGVPVLPDAATWVPPDLELLRAGLTDADRLHPLVASALVPDHRPHTAARSPDTTRQTRVVECRGERHRIGLVDGVLVALDHDPDETRREELLATLGGPPPPCLRDIARAYRQPECLVDVRGLLDHGNETGAIAVVESLLGSAALRRSEALRDELDTAARRRLTHALFRAGLIGRGPTKSIPDKRRRVTRCHPRHAFSA